MNELGKSPRIVRFSWGNIETEDGCRMKDAKMYPGGAREWDWRETGTRHIPGIQPQDVEELLENGANEVILSRGVLKCLKVCPETLEMLDKKNIKFHVLQTEKAVELYNRLRETRAVGGVFHSTC